MRAQKLSKSKQRDGGESTSAGSTVTPPPSDKHSQPTSSAKKRKLLYTPPIESEKSEGDDDYIIISKSYLRDIFTKLNCCECDDKVNINFVSDKLDVQLDIICGTCGPITEKKTSNAVTNMMVYSFMELGVGRNGMDDFLANMNMKPLDKSYQDFAKNVGEAVIEKASENLAESVVAVKNYYRDTLGKHPDQDGILDVRVTFDGSWQKRGHSSLLAVGAVVEAETGLVVDYATISKYCELCSKMEVRKTNKTISDKDFDEWYRDHKSKCTRNYSGSAGGMEVAAAETLFDRSLDTNLRYNVFISDGDSKAYNAVCDLHNGKGPYDGVRVEKAECINHVSKRLGTALRKLRDQVVTEKKTKTGKVRRMSELGGRNELTEK